MNKQQYAKKLKVYLRDETLDEKSVQTLKHYHRVLENFVERLPEGEISKGDIIRYKDFLLETYKPKTISNYITIVNKFIKYCEMTENDQDEFDFKRMKMFYSKNTMKNIKIQQEFSLNEIMEVSEFKRLLRKSKEIGMTELNLIMKVLGYTGIRVSELEYFTVEAIKESNYLQIRNKGKMREIILRNDLRKELLKYAREKKIKSGYIFLGKDNQSCISASSIQKQLKKLAGRCRGIKKSKIYPHSFRHMFAVQFLDAGGTESELADVLGHSSTETTRIYTRTTSTMKRKRMETMYRNK